MRQWQQEQPDDGLDEEEIETLNSGAYADASDAEICKASDLGDPVAYEIFERWPKERRQAATRAVDAADQG
jgi:predicted NBD/HSP70 family sugar kinase